MLPSTQKSKNTLTRITSKIRQAPVLQGFMSKLDFPTINSPQTGDMLPARNGGVLM